MTDQEQLTADLWILDALLTGKDPRNGRGDPNKLVDLDRFLYGELWYLSDGGYSRVYFNDGHLHLTGNERISKSTELWHTYSVVQVRCRIANLCRKLWAP